MNKTLKQYALEILNKSITDIDSFCKTHCFLESHHYPDSFQSSKFGTFTHQNVYIPKDEDDALRQLKSFVDLLQTLQTNVNFTIKSKPRHCEIIPIFKKHEKAPHNMVPFEEMLSLMSPYTGKEFVFDSSQLNFFIKHGFKNKEQYKIHIHSIIKHIIQFMAWLIGISVALWVGLLQSGHMKCNKPQNVNTSDQEQSAKIDTSNDVTDEGNHIQN